MKRRTAVVAVVAALVVGPLTLGQSAAASSVSTVPSTVSMGGEESPESTRQRIHDALQRSADRVMRAKSARELDSGASEGAQGTDTAAVAAAATTDRIFGSNRFATAVLISQRTFVDPRVDFGGIVFIANGLNFPDALAAGPAATSTFGPILLVPPTGALPADVRNEILRLGPDSVAILGKTDNVSAQAEAELRTLLADPSAVFRVAGSSRDQTSAFLSDFVGEWVEVAPGEFQIMPPDTAIISTGLTFADALAGGAAGGWEYAPMLLTSSSTVLNSSVASALQPIPADPQSGFPGRTFTTVRILGSAATVPLAIENQIRSLLPDAHIVRYSGSDRFDTAARLNADVFTGSAFEVTLTNGYRFPDALAGAPLVNVTGGPTIPVRTECLPAPSESTITALAPTVITALGNVDAVSDAALNGLSCATYTVGARAAQQLTNGFTPVPSVASSRSTLNSLTVAAPGPMTGYSRDLFPHWRDADTWGWPPVPNSNCDVRQAALYREGTNVQFTSTCSILGGTWLDAYTTATLFAPSDVDIDHIVPLAEAWRSGAASWTTTRRTQFANDKLEVIAVDDGANASKGDKGPDLWKPPNQAAHCLYAKRWTAIKKAYGLTVTTTEKSALQTMLSTCTT